MFRGRRLASQRPDSAAGQSWDIRPGDPAAFVRFCLVGASGMIVDLSLFQLLLEARLPHPIARAAAIWVAMTWNFLWNRRLTFPGGRKLGIRRQYVRYLVSSGLGAVLSWSTSVGLAVILPDERIWLMAGAVVGIGIGTTTNFLLASRWVFTSRRARAANTEQREDLSPDGERSVLKDQVGPRG